MATLSVIVPNYNHARFLRRRIDTILAQTYQDFELILLDDRSTDNSRSILREYASDARVKLEFNEANSGSTFKQWNKGIRLSKGKYIWIAESDDYAAPGLLDRLVSILDRDPGVVFVFCRSWSVVDEDDNVKGFADFYADPLDPRWQADFVCDGRELCENYFVRDTPIANTSAVVFRRASYDQVGGADESLRICGDWKAWAAMALNGEVAYVSEPLNYYRTHGTTVRNAIWGGRRSLNATYAKERVQVAAWILDRVKPSEAVLEKACAGHSVHWVPAVMSLSVPHILKREILRTVWESDPHPLRSLARMAPAVTWYNIVWPIRNYVWYPILNATRSIRHPLGLNRENISALFKSKGGLPR
jgi:glycosyltransferase involved in cell wall biosynthesis